MQGYDKHAYEPFAVTVDLAVFTIREGTLHVLLVERGQEPYAGRWALPGGFVLPDESAESAARRELAEETGLADVTGLHLEQVRTYSEPDRDPRMRVVSVAYAALVADPPEPRGGGDARRPTARSPSTTTGSSPTPTTGSAPSWSTPDSPRPSAPPNSPSASCGRSTRRCGARSWTPPTSGARSSAPPGSSRPSPEPRG
jgi:8-oxo-dGTP diphosphatase